MGIVKMAANNSQRSKARQHIPSSQGMVEILEVLGFLNRFEDDIRPDMEGQLTPDLFHHPNIPMFQQVMHFLLGLLDANRCQVDFKDCWPVPKTDKKIGVHFGKVAYAWYSQLQAQ